MSVLFKHQERFLLEPLVLGLAALLSACAGSRNAEVPVSIPDPAPESATRVVPLEPLPLEQSTPAPEFLPKAASSPAGSAREEPSRAYAVQLASFQDQQEAQRLLDKLRESFEALVGDLPTAVRRADLGQRGTWYRVLVGEFPSAREARQLCSEFEAQGQDCLARLITD